MKIISDEMYDIMQCMIAYDSTETLENKGL